MKLFSPLMGALAAALVFLWPAPAPAAGPQVLRGHVPAAVSRLQAVSRLDAETNLNLAIGLPLRNREALTNLLQQLYDPASPNYHHYLTPQEFTAQFGPTEADYQALIHFAKTNGLLVTKQYPNRMLLDVRAPVGNIEKALHVSFHVYNHPTQARTFYSINSEPSLDTPVPVLDISGLNNYILPYSKIVRQELAPTNNAVPHAGSGPGGTYIGYDYRAAYVPGVALTGAGQSVALVQFDGYFPSDILQYESLAGLPNVPLRNVLLDGFNGVPGGGSIEVSLDIENVVSMAPGLSEVVLYEGFIPNSILGAIANDNTARQISCSWGWGGGPSGTTDQIFQQMIAQGQTFYDASGDSDAFPPGVVDDPNTPNAPSDNPFITQVGGTILRTAGPLGSWTGERVWNVADGVGSSGGISAFYPLPTWQQGIDMTNNGGSTTFRNLPDVALTADNCFIVAFNGFGLVVGGTSCAAPLWAGLTALMNEQAVTAGDPVVGFINPAIYAIAKGPNYTNAFHDIVVGDNTWSGSTNAFFATNGFDLCTGWGTPASTNLINYLAPPSQVPLPKLMVITNYISGGNLNGAIDPNECNAMDLVLTNIGAANATGVRVSVSTTTPDVVIAQPNSFFPDLPANTSGTNLNSYRISTAPTFICGLPIQLALVIKCDQVTTTNLLVLTTGTPGPIPLRFDNSTFTPIPDVSTTNSVIVVSNVNFALSKVAVSVYINHTFDSDLVLKLVSPDGTTNVLANQLGSNGQNYGLNCSPDTSRTTFDDTAATSIATAVPPFTGTFQPQQPLSVFSGKFGTNVNGAWKLVVSDVAPFDTGAINCWSLLITPSVCTDGGGECPGADVALGMTAAPEPDIVGVNLTYTLSVTNFGPSGAKNVSVSQVLPSSVIFVSAVSSQGSASQNSGVMTANLGAMPAGTTATITVVVMPTTVGVISSSANVTSDQPDFNLSNNSATLFSHINPPTADLSVGLSASPSALFVGGTVAFSMAITNNGPSAATGVLVSNVIPAGFVLLGETVSQGNLAVYGNTVVCSLGSLASGATASATVNATPIGAGSFTANAMVRGNQFDPVGANNSASAVVTVGPAADLNLALVARPNPVVLFSNMTLTASVTNNGPSTATNVVVTEVLPTGAPIISVAVSPSGSVVTNGTTLTCNLGSMARGSSAALTVVVGTTRLGTLNASASVASGITDPNPANNTMAISAQVSQPFVNIVGAGATLTSESISPPDGSIEPGETVTIQFRLQNLGNVSNTNLVVTLASTGGVTSPSAPQTYGILKPIGVPGGVPVSRPFSFTATGNNGGVVTATLQLQDGTNTLPSISYTFPLPTVSTFANTNTITIPDPNAATAASEYGPAAPYPSAIAVSGLTGQVGKVTATLYGLTHDFAKDVNVLLVGPTGAKTLLLSHAADVSAVANATLTFDDAAATNIPASGTTITTGDWQPSAYAPQPIFSNPAPAGPYTAAMATFSGVNPNGTWSLFVLDDSTGDSGYIANGWSLNFTNLSPVNQVADLGLAVVAAPNPVLVGSDLTYTFTVTNAGPSSASGVTFSNSLPAGVTLVSATVSQGNAVINGSTIIGNLGSLAVNSSATVLIVVSPGIAAPASLTNLASVSAFETDFHLIDNTASVVSTVNFPAADVGLNLVSSSGSVIAGSNVTATITVTNNGPGTAFSVVVTSPITSAAAFVSATVSTGSVVTNSSGVVAALGDLPPGDTERVTITVAPKNPGFLTNSASVTTASIDTTLANNSGTIVVTVLRPMPIVVAAGAQLISESLIANGAIDPGETVAIAFSLANTGVVDTANLGATLLASGGVTAPNPASNYFGRLVAGGPPVARTFTFTASPSASGSIIASLHLQDGTNDFGIVPFMFGLPSAVILANTNAIIIPDHGPGLPYPAAITISGMTGIVSKATVTLNGFTHSFASDVNVLLVSPSGHSALLMSHAGGFYGVTNLTLTFDDAAAAPIASSTRLVSGSYKPAGYGGIPNFPSSAPADPYGTLLSAVNGTDPNGAWSLYVMDDRIGDSGVIAAGWTLNLTIIEPVNPIADLALGLSGSPASLFTASALTYTISVTNLGPNSAPGIVVADTLPPGLQIVSTTSSQGAASLSSNLLTCNLGSLNVNGTATVTIVGVPIIGGTFLNSAGVSGAVSDANLVNNSGFTSTLVTVPIAASLHGVIRTNQFQLSIIAQPGMSYDVQSSTDLKTWSSLGVYAAPPNGVITVLDPLGTTSRFYRAVRQVP